MMECLKTLEIAQRNDLFRRTGLNVLGTQGVRNLPDLEGLMAAVRDYNRFTEDNDPYGERDFGSLDWYGEKVFWKIDYYDQELSAWGDPASAECKRVLTVMLADEY
jgi:hypothetical protein